MRPPAKSFRFGPETDSRLTELAAQTGLSETDIIRQAVRAYHRAEFGPEKKSEKSQKKRPSGIATGNTKG